MAAVSCSAWSCWRRAWSYCCELKSSAGTQNSRNAGTGVAEAVAYADCAPHLGSKAVNELMAHCSSSSSTGKPRRDCGMLKQLVNSCGKATAGITVFFLSHG